MASEDLILVDSSSAWQESNKRKRRREESDNSSDKARDSASIPRKRRTDPKLACGICTEEFTSRSIHRLNCECGLLICRSCFNKWISSTGDLPECCGTKMKREDYEHILTPANKRNLTSRKEELANPDPKYCAYCRTYLQDDPGSQFSLRCRKCKRKTCKLCNQGQKDHIGSKGICPEDFHNLELDDLAKKLGWQQCPKCFARIEKSQGCDTIRCLCGSQFKYCCGRNPRSCTCEVAGVRQVLDLLVERQMMKVPSDKD